MSPRDKELRARQATKPNAIANEKDLTSTWRDRLLRLADDEDAMMHAHGKASISALRENAYVTGVAIFTVIGALCFGIDQGIMSVTLVMKHFTQQFPEIAEGHPNAGFNKGVLTALLELGAFVGAFVAPQISDQASRRWAMRVGCVFFLIGGAIQAASYNYGTIVAGRFIGGLGIGHLTSTMGVYISEVAPPNLRGMLLDLDELFVVTGIVVAFYITFGTRYIDSQASFRLPFALQLIPGVLLLVGSFLLPPSPRWLAMKGRDEESLAVLARLRQSDPNDLVVQAEWLGIRAEAQLSREDSVERYPTLQEDTIVNKAKLDMWAWVDVWRPDCWRRTMVSFLLMFFQQLIGINALIYYAPSILESLGLDYDQRLVQSGIINVTQLVGCILSFPLIDRVGRRPLLLWGSAGVTLCMVIVGSLTAVYAGRWSENRMAGKAAIAFLNLYMTAFGLSWGPIAWAQPAEIFSSSRRARGVAVSVQSNWLFNFFVGLFVPPFLAATPVGTFFFFAGFGLLAGIWTYFCVPETKSRTLEQLDKMFHDNSGTTDNERRQRISEALAVEMAARIERDPSELSHSQHILKDSSDIKKGESGSSAADEDAKEY